MPITGAYYRGRTPAIVPAQAAELPRSQYVLLQAQQVTERQHDDARLRQPAKSS
jgi:hypothetical protein